MGWRVVGIGGECVRTIRVYLGITGIDARARRIEQAPESPLWPARLPNAVRSGAAEHRTGRTDLDACRLGTLSAAQDHDLAPRLAKRPGLDVLDPRPVDAEQNLILLLAGGRARVTADARGLVDDPGEGGRAVVVVVRRPG